MLLEQMYLLVCFILPITVNAQTTSLVGDFTHGYTDPKNETVWTVENTRDMWTVYSHGAKETFKAKILSEAERINYWEKMWWPTATAKLADCLTYDAALICHIPKKAKMKIDWIKKNKSDYFHYDAIGGVIEISLTKKTPKVGTAQSSPPKN